MKNRFAASSFVAAFIFGLLGLMVIGETLAQPSPPPRIAVLVTHAKVGDPVFDMLRDGLRQYGWEDRKNIDVDVVTAEGRLERLPELARELVKRKVSVILCPNEVSTRTALKETLDIPIVMIGFGGYDPVSLGFIKSFGQPGGNVTGQYGLDSSLEGKRLQMLRDVLPKVKRIGVLWEDPFGRSGLRELQRAATQLGVKLEPIEVKGEGDLVRAFRTARNRKVGAAMQLWSPTFYVHRDRVAALALQQRLPMMSVGATETGALISYGADLRTAWQRTAYFIDRLLKGSKPAELPVEQVMRFKLVVNMRTAKALGVTFPESILVWADEIIR